MRKQDGPEEHIMEDEHTEDVLGDSRRWLAATIVLLVLLGMILAYYVHALKSLRMEGIDITDVGIGDNAGVTLEGDMQVHNPAALPLDIERIDYDIMLDGDLLGSGNIRGDRIPPKRRATMFFEQDIDLARVASDVTTLADKGRIIVMMRGTITMTFLGVHVKLPFREEQDIRPLIESKIKAIKTRRKETVENIVSRAFS